MKIGRRCHGACRTAKPIAMSLFDPDPFIERIDDTFRWKGQNVATSKVADALTAYPGIVEANVYGVAIPGIDGRAGMAAIVTDRWFRLIGLRAHLSARLPTHAHPVFLRVCGATFRYTKSDLAAEGFAPNSAGEAVYINDPARADYRPLDTAMYARIQAGRQRF
jgi:fatty-acyl-CoA synthase